MRKPSLETLSLLVGVAALAVAVGLPARAASLVVFAKHARNAGAVDGFSAARRPARGKLLATGRHARLPRAVFRSAPTGKKGLRGPAGAKGQAGKNGPAGAQGARGLRGAAGLAGLQGPPGAIGAQGIAGARGVVGPTGLDGDFTRTPAAGALTGLFPDPLLASGAVSQASIATGTVAPADLSPLLSDASGPSLRTLGTDSLQAAPGSDPRLADSRPPRGSAGGDLAGSYPSPAIGAGAVTAAGLGGSARLWAMVSAAGTLVRGHGSVSSEPITNGQYRVLFDRDVSGCVMVATVNDLAATHIGGVAGFPGTAAVLVTVGSLTDPNTFVPEPFTVRVFC